MKADRVRQIASVYARSVGASVGLTHEQDDSVTSVTFFRRTGPPVIEVGRFTGVVRSKQSVSVKIPVPRDCQEKLFKFMLRDALKCFLELWLKEADLSLDKYEIAEKKAQKEKDEVDEEEVPI